MEDEAMASHDHDNADENDGKYSTDEKMTFEGVLKTSLRDRADHRAQLDELVEKDRGSTPPEREAANRRVKRREVAERQREEKASRQREALATKIGQVHLSKSCYLIASGETSRIGLHTTYKFARTKVNDETYYYLVQNTEQSYERHLGELAVKDFGTEWSYEVPEVHPDALQAAVSRQRQADFRADCEPVACLTDDQCEAVEKWYRNRVESELCLLEDMPRQKEESVHVLDQYLVVETNEAMLGLGRNLGELSDRQADVVRGALLRLVEVNTDLPRAVEDHLRESVDYPLLAQITFSTE